MATRTWSAVADGNWSLAANWDGGLSVPATTDVIVFNATSIKNCTIDNLGTWSGGAVQIGGTAYTGTITQASGVNFTSGQFELGCAATFTCHSAATFTCGLFAFSDGTFNQGGAFVSTAFQIIGSGVTPVFNGSSATMSTTAVTFGFAASTATVVATSGIWTLAGSWTQAGTTTFTHNSGTINITAASTFNDTSSTFNKINITGGNIAVTISASTTAPLGANPTTTTGTSALTINGTVTYSGNWAHTGSITTGAAAVITGTSTPTLALNLSLTINATATITNAIGTITFQSTGNATLTDTGDKLSGSTIVLNKSSTATFTIAASTNARFGATPTVTQGSGAFTITGTLTWSGTCSFTTTGLVSTSNGSTLTGSSTPKLTFTAGFTVTNITTVTNAVGTLTFSGGTNATFTDASDLMSASTIIVNKSAATFTVAAGTTCRLGSLATSAATTFTSNGTTSASSTWDHTGALTVGSAGTLSVAGCRFGCTGTFTMTTTATISGAGAELTAIDAAITMNASNTLPADLAIVMNYATGTTRVFTTGDKSFGSFRRAGSGTGQTTITGAMTLSGNFRANDVSSAYTISFTISKTVTAADFLITGAVGNVLTFISSSAGTAATLHTTGIANISPTYMSIKDSTVDASPVWNAGSTSTNVSGNTNWLFTDPASGDGGVVMSRRRRGR